VRKKIKLITVVALVGAGCASHPGAVNSQIEPPPYVMLGMGDNQGNERPHVTALSGKVLLKSDMPIPLSKVRVGLFLKGPSGKKFIYEFSSDTDGSFNITRPLQKGIYELAVTDPRYQGSMEVSLTDNPVTDVSFEISKKK
jgi:hypothetical protein